MTPREWLLLLLALEDTSPPMDPIRLQKGMFLLAQEADIPEADRYSFRPYDYGPFSSQIYTDIETLVEEGLVKAEPAPGYTWQRYTVTEDGLREAAALVPTMSDRERRAARWLAETKRDVLSLSFQRLLRHVYERYPDFAVNSIFAR